MSSDKPVRGKLVVISGPSGVGKSTICREVVRRTGAHLSVSATTRPKSAQETDGIDYYFLSKEEFLRRLEDGDFLEHAQVFDNFYGTPRSKVEEQLVEGKTVILEIDVQGGKQVREFYPDVMLIFILPPSPQVLSQRIGNRGRDNAEVVNKRLAKAKEETAEAWRFYKNMVINDDLEQAIQEVTKIIESGDKK